MFKRLKDVNVLQNKYAFRLYIPIRAVFDLITIGIKNLTDTFKLIPDVDNVMNAFTRVIKKFDTMNAFENIDLFCKSIDGIEGVEYNYKKIKFLRSNIVQMDGIIPGENEFSVSFHCDDNFKLYNSLCLLCDLFYFTNFNITEDIINDLYKDISLCSFLFIYKIDCVTVSKVFRIWGLRPANKPALPNLDRDDIDGAMSIDSVKFIYRYIERVI